MPTKKTVIARALLGAGWLCLSLSAGAYDCSGVSPRTVAAFDGKVKAVKVVEKKNEPPMVLVTFEVSKVYMGTKKKQVTVATPAFGFGDSIGYPFMCGESYHVAARRDDPYQLYTDLCMPTRGLSSGAMDPGEIGGILLGGPDSATKAQRDKLWKRLYCE